MRVWRNDLQVFHRTIGAAEAAALRALARGATFEAMCDALVERGEEGAHAALTMLQAWLGDEALCGLDVVPAALPHSS